MLEQLAWLGKEVMPSFAGGSAGGAPGAIMPPGPRRLGAARRAQQRVT